MGPERHVEWIRRMGTDHRMSDERTHHAEDDDVLGAGAPRQSQDLGRDPEDWATGDEPMTAAQRSYLDNLAKQAGEQLPANLTKAQASEHIDRLKGHADGTDGRS
jgi:hypothetical protein